MTSARQKTIWWPALLLLIALASTSVLAQRDDHAGSKPCVATTSVIHSDASMQKGGAQSNDKNNRGGWSKFRPSAGGRSTVDMNDKGGRADQHSPTSSNDRPPSPPERSKSAPEPAGDRDGGQRFPWNSGGWQNNSPVSRKNGAVRKPQLELNKPIVTPRNSPPDARNGGGYDHGNPAAGIGGGNSNSFDRGASGDRGAVLGGSAGSDRGQGRSSAGLGGNNRNHSGSERNHGGGQKSGGDRSSASRPH